MSATATLATAVTVITVAGFIVAFAALTRALRTLERLAATGNLNEQCARYLAQLVTQFFSVIRSGLSAVTRLFRRRR